MGQSPFDMHGITTRLLTVLQGQSALLVGASGGLLADRVIWHRIKYISGGTLELIGAGLTCPVTGSSHTARQGTGYPFGTTETLEIQGPARYYLMATGSNVVAALIQGLSSPGGNDL